VAFLAGLPFFAAAFPADGFFVAAFFAAPGGTACCRRRSNSSDGEIGIAVIASPGR
jgi:hypothetical protein